MPAKKSASKPEPEEETAPVSDEPVEEAEPVEAELEPVPAEADEVPQPDPASAVLEPEPAVHAGGHVLTEDKGWVPEEGS